MPKLTYEALGRTYRTPAGLRKYWREYRAARSFKDGGIPKTQCPKCLAYEGFHYPTCDVFQAMCFALAALPFEDK